MWGGRGELKAGFIQNSVDCLCYSGSVGTKAQSKIASRQTTRKSVDAIAIPFTFLLKSTRIIHDSATPQPRKNGSIAALESVFPESATIMKKSQIT